MTTTSIDPDREVFGLFFVLVIVVELELKVVFERNKGKSKVLEVRSKNGGEREREREREGHGFHTWKEKKRTIFCDFLSFYFHFIKFMIG